MKVLLSAYGCDPDRGSEPRIGWHVATELARNGNEVWVLTHPDGCGHAAEAWRHEPAPDGLHVQYVHESVLGRRLTKRWWMLRYMLWQRAAYRAAQSLANGIEFDVVHHLGWGSLQGGSRLWRLGRPFVFGPVGGGQIAPPEFRRYFGRQWFHESVRSFIATNLIQWLPTARGAVRNAELVLAANEETATMARRLGAKHVELCCDVALPEVSGERYKPRPPTDELKVLWVGRIMPRKALPLAIEAIEAVSPDHEVELLVVGGHIDPHEIGKKGRVRKLGQLPWEATREMMQQADVMLFTSLRDTTGQQIVEAMGAGLPVITLDHQGARTLIDESCGARVPVTTPEETVAALAATIERFADHPELREELGRAAQTRAAMDFTWPARTATLEKHYWTVMS